MKYCNFQFQNWTRIQLLLTSSITHLLVKNLNDDNISIIIQETIAEHVLGVVNHNYIALNDLICFKLE